MKSFALKRLDSEIFEEKSKHSFHIHHSNPISQEISSSHIQSIRKNVQDSIGRKYFELDNELLKNSATGQ